MCEIVKVKGHTEKKISCCVNKILFETKTTVNTGGNT